MSATDDTRRGAELRELLQCDEFEDLLTDYRSSCDNRGARAASDEMRRVADLIADFVVKAQADLIAENERLRVEVAIANNQAAALVATIRDALAHADGHGYTIVDKRTVTQQRDALAAENERLRAAEPEFLLDCLAGKLTTFHQICGYVSQLELQRDALAAGLNDIAKGMCPPDVMKLVDTATPEEFRSAMWTWSQKRAREALATLTGSDKDE